VSAMRLVLVRAHRINNQEVGERITWTYPIPITLSLGVVGIGAFIIAFLSHLEVQSKWITLLYLFFVAAFIVTGGYATVEFIQRNFCT